MIRQRSVSRPLVQTLFPTFKYFSHELPKIHDRKFPRAVGISLSLLPNRFYLIVVPTGGPGQTADGAADRLRLPEYGPGPRIPAP